MAVDAASLINEVLMKMKLNPVTPTAITRAQVLLEVNNCLRELTETTYLFIKREDTAITLETDQPDYLLPTDLYDVIRVYNWDKYTIYPITESQLEEMHRQWMDDTGEPLYYLLGQKGMRYITFYKKPSVEFNGEYVGLRYRYYPTELVDEATSYLPESIQNTRDLVSSYCLSKLFRTKTEVQDVAKANDYLMLYTSNKQRWESLPKAPEKQRVYGSRGERLAKMAGPQLPSNYPSWRW